MAATLVIYETMLPPRKILGNWEYGRWQCPPALAGALKIFPSGEAELNFSVENGQVEKVSLSSLTVEWINRYRDLHPPSIHLFAGDRGKPFGDKHWLLSMRQMLRILGLPRAGFGLRSLRLGRAEDMLEAGIGMQDIRAAGRWKTLSIAYRLTADRSIESSQRSLEASKGKHKTAGDLLATDRNSTQYQAAIKRYRDFSTSGGPYTGDLFAA